MRKRAPSPPNLEQLDLFITTPERPRWSQFPDRDRAEIVALLAEMLLARVRGERSPESAVEVGHE
jgi:hypothetical protein